MINFNFDPACCFMNNRCSRLVQTRALARKVLGVIGVAARLCLKFRIVLGHSQYRER